MKIFFEDGQLINTNQLPFVPDVIINAAYGPTKCIDILEDRLRYNPEAVVYTNCSKALYGPYCWNKDTRSHECYIRAGEHMIFTQIQMLTNRELREGHNIEKMYFSGEFDWVLKQREDMAFYEELRAEQQEQMG